MSEDLEYISEYPLVGEDKAAADEDVFIYGPPGTGKTTQLKRRLHGVFRNTDRHIGDYTFVTYRRSQARETVLELQAEGWIADGALQNPARGETRYVGTLHGVCRRLIEDRFSAGDYADTFGDAKPGVASGPYRREWCEENNITYSPGAAGDTIGELLFRVWSWSRMNWPAHADSDAATFDDLATDVQRRCMMSAPAWDSLRTKWRGDPVELYTEYRNGLYDEGLMDFTDMLETVLEHGLTPPTEGVVVDEAHDLSPVMLSVVMLWAGDADHVMIAGDKDQVINRFDGARRRLYERIPDYLGLPEVLLDTSWRLPPTIWTAARIMLENAHDAPPVEPRNTTGPGGSINVRESPRFSPNWNGPTWTDDTTPDPDEQNSPVQQYERHVGEDPYEDYMALARTRRQVEGVQYVFDAAGVPYVTQSGLRGWLTPLNPDMDDATRRSVYNLVTKLAKVDVDTVTDHQTIQHTQGKRISDVTLNRDEVEAWAEYVPLDIVDHESRDELREYVDLTDPVLDAAKLPLLREGWTAFTDSRTTGVNALNKWYRSESEYQSVRRAFDRYTAPMTRGVPRSVKIMTIHASKGDEADVVAVYDGVTSRITDQITEDTDARQNEYRTWYVAFSRCRHHLIVFRGAWGMNTTSLIPDDFTDRVLTAAEKHHTISNHE